MGYTGMVWFAAVLVINRVSIFAILVINRVWFLHSSLKLSMFFFNEATLLSLLKRPSTINNWFMLQRALSSYGARGKFGEHERSVRVARGVAEGNSSFLSALQTSQVLHNSIVHS